MNQSNEELRREEILEACSCLYGTKAFQEITLKDISGKTSLSRPSIYNYFSSKEEIFLALLKREFTRWNSDLEQILAEASDAAGFAGMLAASLGKRTLMLKIQCMNLYEIEEHSSDSSLTSFKQEYSRSRTLVGSILGKLFPEMPEEDRNGFIFEFFPFMYGIYPYAYPTEKQQKAMEAAGMEIRRISIEAITEKFILDILGRR